MVFTFVDFGTKTRDPRIGPTFLACTLTFKLRNVQMSDPENSGEKRVKASFSQFSLNLEIRKKNFEIGSLATGIKEKMGKQNLTFCSPSIDK